MDLRTREAIRYLGYGKNEVDATTYAFIQESFLELEHIADKKSVIHMYDLAFATDGKLKFGPMEIWSKDLSKNLTGCKKAYLFAATLGTEVDRYIRKYEVTNLPKAVVFQACAAAFLEEYCDALEETLAASDTLRPRYSPGYGDFSIFHQKDILQMLDAAKNIGLTMTEGYMMTPSKSVTAVIGVCDMKE